MELENILTNDEVREALSLDSDYNMYSIEDYSSSATFFVFQKTGYKAEPNEVVHPFAKQLAKLYLKSLFYGDDGLGMSEHLDYTIGINSLIKDLEDVVRFADENS